MNNKQLLEQEAKEYMHDTMKGFVGDFDFSPTYLQYAYIAGATSSSTVKNLESRVSELEESLSELINDWIGEEPFKDEPVHKQHPDMKEGYWTPAGKIVKAKLIYKAQQLLNL